MKKIFCAILMSMAAVSFADQPANPLPVSSDLPPLSSYTPPPKQGFVYVRFMAAEHDLAHADTMIPGLGIGYRRLSGNGAADLSISGIGFAEHRSGRFFWTAPKASYIRYAQPDAKQSAYLGAGLAWGGLEAYRREQDRQEFIGLVPSIVGGYEFAHRGFVLGFAELTFSQPLLPVYQRGPFPGPCVELSTGIGF